MIDVYLESGAKRVVAVARDWPGWLRRGNDEASALEALLEVAPRYMKIMEGADLGFKPPARVSDLNVCERVAGNTSSDMGIPDVVLGSDEAPMGEQEQARAAAILRACWAAFDRAMSEAQGKELRKGPRGGGRELDGIARHVAGAEAGYAARTGAKSGFETIEKMPDAREALAAAHDLILEALAAVAPVGVPPPGPRGGKRWPARYFVRRVAYHVVDHLWEIEDRSAPQE